MAVFRVKKDKNFTAMSNYHFKDKRLSWKAKGILSNMLSLPDGWDYSLAGLTTLSSDGITSTRSAIKELEQYGYLIRQHKREAGKFVDLEYLIFEQPQSENLQSEKQPQLNTKQLNTKISNTKGIESKEVRESYDTILNTLVEDEELKELYVEFIKMRQMKKKPLTNKALKLLIGRAERLSNLSVYRQKLMLEAAIFNCWDNIYLPNDEVEKEQNMRKLKDFYDIG